MAQADANGIIPLEEEVDKDYEPTETEIKEYAEWLEIDVEADADLLWIAKQGLKAPLPAPWKPCQTGDDGEVFYFNYQTGESVWDHPCDEYHRKLYATEKELKDKRKANGAEAGTQATAAVPVPMEPVASPPAPQTLIHVANNSMEMSGGSDVLAEQSLSLSSRHDESVGPDESLGSLTSMSESLDDKRGNRKGKKSKKDKKEKKENAGANVEESATPRAPKELAPLGDKPGLLAGIGLASRRQEPDSSGKDEYDDSFGSVPESLDASRTGSSGASNGRSLSGASGKDHASKSAVEKDAEGSSDGDSRRSEDDEKPQARHQNDVKGAPGPGAGSGHLDQLRGGGGTPLLPSVAEESASDVESPRNAEACKDKERLMRMAKTAERNKLEDALNEFVASERQRMETEKRKLLAELEVKRDESLREIRESHTRELEAKKAALSSSASGALDSEAQPEISAEQQRALSELAAAQQELAAARASTAKLELELREPRDQVAALLKERDEQHEEALRQRNLVESSGCEVQRLTVELEASVGCRASERLGEAAVRDRDKAAGEVAVLQARVAELTAEHSQMSSERDAARAEVQALREQRAALPATDAPQDGERHRQSVASQVESLTRAVVAMRRTRKLQEELEARASTG